MEQSRGEQPTAADHFRSMIGRIHMLHESRNVQEGKRAGEEAVVFGMAILNSPSEQKRRVARELRTLMQTAPDTALEALRILQQAGNVRTAAVGLSHYQSGSASLVRRT